MAVIAISRRSMRSTTTLILSAALVGSLAACSAPLGTSACEPVIPVGEAAGYVSASGEVGSEPTVTFPTPLQTNGAQQAPLVAGEGDAIAAGQIVDFQASLFDGENGELITATAYDPEQTPLRRTAGADTDLLAQVVQCLQVGSRTAVTGTVADVFGPSGLDPALGYGIDHPIVLVIDVDAAYLGRATGTPQLGANGIPAVVTTPKGVPGVTIPREEPPTELRSHTLVLGHGPALEAGDRAVMHYTGLVWSTRLVFDSTWQRGTPATFPIVSFEDDPAGIVPGLAQALVGQTVGSQVVVVVPPELGYPEGQEPATIPPATTLVFVVDILGIQD